MAEFVTMDQYFENFYRYELEKLREDMQGQDVQLSAKQNNMKKLEMQLTSAEGETSNLRNRIAELESEKQALEGDNSQWTLSVATLQAEKDGIQAELKSVRESEANTVSTMEDIKDVNRNLEACKRQLTKYINELTDQNTKLDQENSLLEKEKVDLEDDLQELNGKNTKLTEEVSELSKNLDNIETVLKEVKGEKESLAVEAAARSEALGTMKHSLAEVQIQRGKLNNTIAKIAQEKGDLIREKVTLSAEIAKFKETAKIAEDRATSLASVNERLDKNVEELKVKNNGIEKVVEDLEKHVFALQQEKQDILMARDKMMADKDEEASRKLSAKNLELQKSITAAKTAESELRACMQQVSAAAERKRMEKEVQHKNEVKELTEQHNDTVSHLKKEIEAISKARAIEGSRLQKQKEVVSKHYEEEKALLSERIEKLQANYDEKCSEARAQYEQFNHLLAEQRAQLDTSTVNSRRLESELSIAEQRLQNLQNKLDEVKQEATVQIDSLNNRLKNSSRAISQLESVHNDTLITISKLEGQRDSLQREKHEAQKKLEITLTEKADLHSTNKMFRQNLLTMEKELAKINEMVKSLQVKLKQSEDARTVNETDASEAHRTLTKVENLHTQLVSDHAALQASFTSSEQEKTNFQIDLRSAEERINRLEKQREGLVSNLGTLENRLNFVTKLGELREKEISNFQQRAASLERERNELSANLTKVQETLRKKGKVDAATKSELQSHVSELKSLRDSLKEEINTLKIDIDSSRQKFSETDSKLSATSGQASILASELKQALLDSKNLRSKYMELVGVLSGTLGVSLYHDKSLPPPPIPSQGSATTSFTVEVAESGVGDSISPSFQSSFTNPSDYSQMSVSISCDSVREAILELQKNVILADKLKAQALSSVSNLEKNISRLEKEKGILESKLQTATASFTTVQRKFDEVSKQTTRAEGAAGNYRRGLEALDGANQQLQSEVVHLRQQVDSHGSAKMEAEHKVKKLAVAQANTEMDNKQNQMKVAEKELQIKQLKETITKQKAIITNLQASKDTKEADILSLQQKLRSSQHALSEAESQMRTMKENIHHIGFSHKNSQEREAKLIQKIHELESTLVSAQSKKVTLDKKVQNLIDEVGELKKERKLLENKLLSLTNSQIEKDVEKEQLQVRIKKMESSLNSESVNQKELMSTIKSMEVQLCEKENHNEETEKRMVKLVQEKEALSFHIQQVEDSLKEALKGKQVANDLCSNLEAEKDFLHNELSVIREENLRLKGELREATYQSQRMDILMSTQQKQKTELDDSLIVTSKRNVELMKSLRDERTSAAEREKNSKDK